MNTSTVWKNFFTDKRAPQ